MSGVRGFDNLYSESVNDVALQNYNRGIAQRLRMQQTKAEQNLPFKEPKMLGGVRFSNTILAGTTAEPPPTLAVGGRAFRTFTGMETPAQGGKVNRLKKSEKWLGFTKKVIGDGFDIYDQAKARGGKVNRLKKAEKYLGLTKKIISDGFDVYDMAKERGGKVNRLKKSEKWLDFSKKVVGDAFNIYDQAKARGGMVYSQSLKDALGGCGSCEGGAVKPRKPRVARFVKGSQEAKDHMARIRAMKK
jgi:hypothetical protein